MSCELWHFPLLGGRNITIPSSVWAPWNVPSAPFCWFLPQTWVVSHTHVAVVRWRSKEDRSLDPSSSLFTSELEPLWPPQTPNSNSSNHEGHWDRWFPPPYTAAWNSLQALSWRNDMVSPYDFSRVSLSGLPLSEINVLRCLIDNVWKPLLHIFCPVFKWEDTLSLHFSFLFRRTFFGEKLHPYYLSLLHHHKFKLDKMLFSYRKWKIELNWEIWHSEE